MARIVAPRALQACEAATASSTYPSLTGGLLSVIADQSPGPTSGLGDSRLTRHSGFDLRAFLFGLASTLPFTLFTSFLPVPD